VIPAADLKQKLEMPVFTPKLHKKPGSYITSGMKSGSLPGQDLSNYQPL
jgi:hypothetical protein